MCEFVRVAIDEALAEEAMELPAEDDGSLLLDSLKSQFEGATGLKYRNSETGGWRGVRLSEGVLHPPHGLWGDGLYVVVMPHVKVPQDSKEHSSDAVKRKMMDDNEVDRAAKNPRHTAFSDQEYEDMSQQHQSEYYTGESDAGGHGDLIVLGLAYSATDKDLRTYFSKYGEVEFGLVKRNQEDGSSRGFGFVRMKDPAVQLKILNMEHIICGRRCELRSPKRHGHPEIPSRVFVGRLPATIRKEDLTEHFEKYGTLRDVYIPQPFRGFAFITFLTGEEAEMVIREQHVIKGHPVNVTYAEPRGKDQQMQQAQHAQAWAQYYAQQGWMATATPTQQPAVGYQTRGGAVNPAPPQPDYWGAQQQQQWVQQPPSSLAVQAAATMPPTGGAVYAAPHQPTVYSAPPGPPTQRPPPRLPH